MPPRCLNNGAALHYESEKCLGRVYSAALSSPMVTVRQSVRLPSYKMLCSAPPEPKAEALIYRTEAGRYAVGQARPSGYTSSALVSLL